MKICSLHCGARKRKPPGSWITGWKNSFHVIINNLIGYQFIAAFINDGPGRKNARRFAPLLTRNEYAGLQIATTEHYKASDIPEIIAAIFKYTKDADKEELLPKIEEAVRRCK